MSRRRITFGAIVLATVLVAGGAVSAISRAVRGHHVHRRRALAVRHLTQSAPQTEQITCPAPALGGQLPAVVYLPQGYSSSTTRFPVIYFLHGLPADPATYTRYAFVGQAVATGTDRAIVVAPQGVKRPHSDPEYLDWSATDDWPKAIGTQLVSCIDSRYRTIASRRGRALVGLSAGGYGAFNIGLRTLDTFGAVEAWSGYFVATDPSGYQVLKLPTAAARAAATVPRGRALVTELRRWPSLIAFYVGAGDNRFARDNEAFDRSLTASHVRHVFRTYAGGHSNALWASHAAPWLRMALVYLATNRVISP